MTDLAAFTLRSRSLGALPVVQHFLDRLGLDQLLEQYVPQQDRRFRIRPATALGILLRNIILGRRPIYGLQEWAQPFVPSLLGLEPDQVDGLNDDRVGRALNRLFDADRASLMTTIVVRAMQEFDVKLDQFHNDSTSITFSGNYSQATGRKIRGRKAVSITYGHNKDHRPDLKQLLWILTVSADGSVPVHYRLCDGNTSDDPTHIQTWEALCKLTGRTDFLYVADCKLCTRANLDHIAHGQGRFITVLPSNRKEDAWFRKHIQDHDLPWEEVIHRPNPHGVDRLEDVWRVVPDPEDPRTFGPMWCIAGSFLGLDLPSAGRPKTGTELHWLPSCGTSLDVGPVLLTPPHSRNPQASAHAIPSFDGLGWLKVTPAAQRLGPMRVPPGMPKGVPYL